MPAGLVPQRKLNPIPESKFVKDDAQVVFHQYSVVPIASATSLFLRPWATSAMTCCWRGLGTRLPVEHRLRVDHFRF